MSSDWPQQAATFFLVGLAGLYAIRRAWGVFHPSTSGASGCGSGGCSSCPSNAASGAESPVQVVTIGMPKAAPRR